jgi:tetratricopeptide (TPR) repeat protein
MNYKYKNLSVGYTGIVYQKSTINSLYYGLFFEEANRSSDILNTIFIFPQRIPRSGFHVELYNLETDEYRINFDEIINKIKQYHLQFLTNLSKNNSEINARRYINWSNILLRYGCFENLLNYFPKNYSGVFALEIKMLRESAKIEMMLSEDKMISPDEQLELAEIFIDNDAASDREKIMLLNQIIVNFHRYQKEKHSNKKIFQLSKILLDLTQKFESTDFINMLHCSVAYRGLAMENTFGNKIQISFLNKAEELARNIRCQSEIERVVASDNLFTCLQSISKWHLHNKNLLQAENHLCELITIDPYDSTGYSELGFYYLNLESYEKAADCFRQALELGAPGVGMHTYYYAKCLENLGKDEEAIIYLYEATKLDEQGISAWLDLMNHFLQKNEHAQACQIANHIHSTPILTEQLEDEEKIIIQTLAN